MRSQSTSTWRQSYLSLYLGGLGVLLIGILLTGDGGANAYGVAIGVLGLCLLVAAQVCAGVLLYRSWRCVDRNRDRLERGRRVVDPGAAVVFTFVPLLNVVGAYLSLGLLPGALNDLARRTGVARRVPASLGLACAGLLTSALIPVVGRVLAVGLMCCLPTLFFSCSKLAEEIESSLVIDDAGMPPAAPLG